MATANEEVATGIDGLPAQVRAPASASRLRALYELTKPNLSALVVVTAVIGFYLATPRGARLDWALLLALVVGTAATAGGACALNMALEHPLDGRMRRTRARPIPSGRLGSVEALVFALGLFAAGFALLVLLVGWTPALLSLLTLVIYAFIYTPLKRRGPLSIWVGAIPGAIPPLMGWTALRPLEPAAFSIFAILFAWQFPHFLSLAWMYREDYARAGFRFLPEGEGAAQKTGRSILVGCAGLVVVSLLPALLGVAGPVYAAGALAAGLAFAWPCVQVARDCTPGRARTSFLASVTYLPALLALLILDRLL